MSVDYKNIIIDMSFRLQETENGTSIEIEVIKILDLIGNIQVNIALPNELETKFKYKILKYKIYHESAYLFLFGVGSLFTELFAFAEILFTLISYQCTLLPGRGLIILGLIISLF